MNIFKKTLLGVTLACTILIGSASPALACCGDGKTAAEGAIKAGENLARMISKSAEDISLWLVQLNLTISNGFGKLYGEIAKQTASMRTFEQGNIAVQSQLLMSEAAADAQTKYELSPRACFETSGGLAAGMAAGEVKQTINDLNRDFARRTLFTPNTSAAVGKIYDDHVSKYCSQQDADLGRCSRAVDPTLQNADVRADATLNTASYTPDQLAAARAFVSNVANPVPTQNIPKDWEKTDQGKMFIAGQYVEQGRASVAANSLNAAVAARIPIQGLGSAAMMNKPNMSELELMESQVRGRFESPAWYQMIAGFSLENLFRELVKTRALSSSIDLKSYQQMERVETVLATQLAITVRQDSEQRMREARASAAKAGR